MVTNLVGRSIVLRPFTVDQITDRYRAWLTDPVVNYFSRRRNMPPETAANAVAYLQSRGPEEKIFAILHADFGHVGNISYGPIDRVNERSQVGIFIGEPKAWGRGIGTEAVYLVARHLFEDQNLHRVEAGSSNPAFIRLSEKLGWVVEGVERDRTKIDGNYFSETLVAQLRHEFDRRPEFEPAATER
jgi:[ribosomal protein S5]-alanine N-acetyltransferase